MKSLGIRIYGDEILRAEAADVEEFDAELTLWLVGNGEKRKSGTRGNSFQKVTFSPTNATCLTSPF